MTTDLHKIIQWINGGDFQEAERALRSLLQDDPRNTDAWMLLANLVQDPAQREACYRRVLRIDPENRRAARRLEAQSGQPHSPHLQKTPASKVENDDSTLRCPQCGGTMGVRFVGDMQDKRAACPYCHTEVDLPDSFKRVKTKRAQQRSLLGTRTMEETVIETRRDGKLDAEELKTLPSEIQAALRVLKEKAPTALDHELLEALKANAVQVSTDTEVSSVESSSAFTEDETNAREALTMENLLQEERIKTEKRREGFFSRLFSRKRKPERKPGELSLAEMIELAGGGLPPEERRQCPNPRCGATVSKEATKCPWCGEAL